MKVAALLIFSFGLVTSGGCKGPVAGATQVGLESHQWLAYQNDKYKLAFSYPSNLLPQERDPQKYGLPALRLALDLVQKDDPSQIVLRLMVSEFVKDRMVYVPTKASLTAPGEKYETTFYNGFEIIKQFQYGSAARHWQVYHFGAYVYEWFTFIAEEDAQDGPRDSSYPILTILKGVRYDYHNGRVASPCAQIENAQCELHTAH